MRLVAVMVVVAACGENEHRGGGELIVSPAAGLHTSEAGGTATFTIAITERPDRDVTVRLASENPKEGTVAPEMLVFTPNAYAPQSATATGVDDPYVDGTQSYVIDVTATGSILPIASATLTMFNDDDDVANAIAIPHAGLLTSEAGLAATFTVVLTAKPLADVTIPIASSRPSEGVTDIGHMTFTGSNWDLAQTVTVTGVDDKIADGAQPYTIVLGAAISLDPAYAGLDPADVLATNVDDDVEAIVVVPTTGLVTTEAGGTDQFKIVLASQPIADVTIPITAAPASEVQCVDLVTFTAQNWSVPQTVTVTGVDDLVVDGDRDFVITLAPAVSADPRYNGLDAADVRGTNLDNDTPGIDATPKSALVTSERGTNAYFSVVLHSQPIADVTVAVTSTDTTEGTVFPSSLVFTAATWNQPQTVTVHGIDDAIVDGDIAYRVTLGPATSTDLVYSGLVGDQVGVTNLDNDRAGFVIDPASNLVVSEFGDSETFTITLAKRPTATVRVNLSSSDLTEGFVAPAQLVFTTASWNQPHVVTVTGVDDLVRDGNQPFTIITAPATSADPAYNGLDAPDVGFTNIDNETPQVYVKTKPLLATSENGAVATYQVRLTVAPTATVVCPATSTDSTEGIANPAGLTFTAGSYGFQTVTITGIDDAIKDGDQLYEILDGTCTSADPAYTGADPPDVHVVNRDND